MESNLMEIEYHRGDLFQCSETIICHGCNARGKMGSGVAKIIREKYPEAYEYYNHIHLKYGLILGEIYPIESNGKIIVNAITQQNYGYDGKLYTSYTAIENCIKQMSEKYDRQRIAMPMIGSGLGGGDWHIISELIEEHSTFQPVVYKL